MIWSPWMRVTGHAAVVVCAMTCAAACGGASASSNGSGVPPPIQLTDADNGRSVSLTEGQSATIVLASHADGGYSFSAPQLMPASVMSVQSDVHSTANCPTPAPGAAPLLGCSGNQVIRLVAAQPGTATFEIVEAQPFDPSQQLPAFKVTFAVSQ